MDFSDALNLMKGGKKVSREKWHKPGMSISIARLETGSQLRSRKLPGEIFRYIDIGSSETSEFFVMEIPQEKIVIGWLASQTDLLAEDWYEVMEKRIYSS